MDPLRHVKFFATVKHTGQLYSSLPYTHHLAAVENVLRRFGVSDETLLTAAWLHDVVEDTNTSLTEVEEMFGSKVAQLVHAVTNENGSNRKTRNLLTYPKIRAIGTDAIKLKLADRIANVEAGGNLFKMYKKEYGDFRQALFIEGQNEEMWHYLDMLLK